MIGLHRVGLLERVDAISAVSGGSIVAAAYGLARTRAATLGRTFDFDGFVAALDTAIARGVRTQALARLAIPTFFPRWLLKGATRTDLLADTYERVFFEGATLADLPVSPAIYLNTTCLNVSVAARPFRYIERRALMLHGELHVYHYLQIQRANGFGPVLNVTGSELPTIKSSWRRVGNAGHSAPLSFWN